MSMYQLHRNILKVHIDNKITEPRTYLHIYNTRVLVLKYALCLFLYFEVYSYDVNQTFDFRRILKVLSSRRVLKTRIIRLGRAQTKTTLVRTTCGTKTNTRVRLMAWGTSYTVSQYTYITLDTSLLSVRTRCTARGTDLGSGAQMRGKSDVVTVKSIRKTTTHCNVYFYRCMQSESSSTTRHVFNHTALASVRVCVCNCACLCACVLVDRLCRVYNTTCTRCSTRRR